MVLQFRSVRMLIAQDQLEQVSRQVRVSGQPVIVADARGRVLLANDAFDRLLRAPPTPRTLDELPPRFAGAGRGPPAACATSWSTAAPGGARCG